MQAGGVDGHGPVRTYEKRRVDVEALANLNAPKLPREFIKSVCSADSVESATHYQHIERSD